MSAVSFLEMNFTALKLDHQKIFNDFFEKHPQTLANYTFASLLAWDPVYSYAWIYINEDTLLIATYNETTKEYHLLQPLGVFSIDTQKLLLKAISTNSYPIKLFGVSNSFIEQHPEFCAHFTDLNDRKYANYVYKSVDLATLAGRRYEKKRNLISQAEKLYTWKLHPLCEQCRPHCPKILMQIGSKKPAPPSLYQSPVEIAHLDSVKAPAVERSKKGVVLANTTPFSIDSTPRLSRCPNGQFQPETGIGLENELKALNAMLDHFTDLHQKGFMITIDGQPAAFSIYERLNPTTAVIHFEKAEKSFKGLYQLINRETAKAIFKEGYTFINREEDLGIDGLRKAKMSYFPEKLITVHTLTWNN